MSQINAVGRRKAAVARIFLKPGSGQIMVNGKDYKEYFTVDHLLVQVERPLKISETEGQFDLKINVRGGGIKGQAEAVRLGICRVLVKNDAEVKPLFKAESLMTRDARKVERKKPGLRKARKKAQFSKR